MSKLLYLIRRLVTGCLVLWGVITIVFFISHMVPGDATLALVGPDASPEIIAQMQSRFGLDKPLYVQYALYIKNLVIHQDFGFSILNQRPVADDIRRYFPATFEIVTIAIVLATALAVPLGVISAVKKDQWEDHLSRLVAIAGISLPVFWLGLLLQIVFAYYLHWTPLHGIVSMGVTLKNPVESVTGFLFIDTLITGNWPVFFDHLHHLILPVITLAYPSIALIARMTRSSMLEVMNLEYISAAIANGVPRRRVIWRHALPNAIIPTLTIIGMAYSYLLGGTVLVETIFDWPGLGLYAVNGIFNVDYPSIVGVTLVYGFFRVFINLLVDLSYFFIDPRITFETGGGV
jgi:peptide/nickel transport system permease protein